MLAVENEASQLDRRQKMQRIRTFQQFLSRFPVACRVPVQWGEQDAFNHLNNVQYVRYMENARIKYFKALLLEIRNPQPDHLAFLTASGLGPILSETYVKFLHPVHAGDTIVVGATGKLADGSKSRLLLQHSMWSIRKARVVAEGSSTVVSFNYPESKVQDFLPAIAGKRPLTTRCPPPFVILRTRHIFFLMHIPVFRSSRVPGCQRPTALGGALQPAA
jgi:acyl-CoA thioester hydrolase